MKLDSPHIIATVIGMCSVGASFVAPTMYVSSIKEVNAVQDVRISNVESAQVETKTEIKELNTKLDALLIANGINPNSLK